MRSLLMSACVCLTACATTKPATPAPSPAPVAAPTAPVEDDAARAARIEALFARESEPGTAQTFSVGGHELSSESAGPIAVTRQDEAKASVLTFGLTGASSKATCYLFDHPFDPGTVVSRTLESAKKSVTFKQLRPDGVEVIEKAPGLFLEAAYVATAQPTTIGHLLLMVYANDEAPMMCIFDEPGFVKSFRRAAGALAAAVAKGLASPTKKYAYRSVDITRIGQVDVGFSRVAWVKGEDGLTEVRTSSTMLVPRSATDLLTTDSATEAVLEKDSTIKRKAFVSANNGEVERQLVLTHGKGGTYGYAGTAQGKALQGELKTKDGKGLPSDVGQAKLLRELVGGKKKELQLEDYMPDADPTAFTPVKLKREDGPRAVSLEVGPVVAHTRLDEGGMAEAITMDMGPVKLDEVRVFFEGSAK